MDHYLALEQQDHGNRLEPDVVLALGEQAARAYVDQGTDLTVAVLSAIEGKSLNPAHVCRIVETANQRAYLLVYDSLPGPSRVVTFPGGPARIFDVLDRTFPAGAPAGEEQVTMSRPRPPTLDYALAPSHPMPSLTPEEMPKAASARDVPNLGDILPEKMSADRHAELMGQYYNSPGGRVALYHTLKSASDNGHQDVGGLIAKMRKLGEELGKLAHTALQEGYNSADVARVVLEGADRNSRWAIAQEALRKVGAAAPDPRNIPWGREVTPNHPLAVKAAEMIETAKAAEKKLAGLRQVDKALADVRKRLGG